MVPSRLSPNQFAVSEATITAADLGVQRSAANDRPAATIATRPTADSPSEVTHGGSLAAIHMSSRFSAVAVRLALVRTCAMVRDGIADLLQPGMRNRSANRLIAHRVQAHRVMCEGLERQRREEIVKIGRLNYGQPITAGRIPERG